MTTPSCLMEKQLIFDFIDFGLTRLGTKPMIHHHRGEHANHNSNYAVTLMLINVNYTHVTLHNILPNYILCHYSSVHKQFGPQYWFDACQSLMVGVSTV